MVYKDLTRARLIPECKRLSDEFDIDNLQELKMIVHQTKEGMHCLHKKYMEDFVYLARHLNNIDSAASGYQKVLEENRKLYNQMQDLKGETQFVINV